MIVLLDTSTPDCNLKIVVDNAVVLEDVWHADRELAEKIFSYLEDKMAVAGKKWSDITGIGLFKGPGSFTGLRIGASVCNTIAYDRKIPIVGASGETWQQQALDRLKKGEDDQIVLPYYGRPARITSPRK